MNQQAITFYFYFNSPQIHSPLSYKNAFTVHTLYIFQKSPNQCQFVGLWVKRITVFYFLSKYEPLFHFIKWLSCPAVLASSDCSLHVTLNHIDLKCFLMKMFLILWYIFWFTWGYVQWWTWEGNDILWWPLEKLANQCSRFSQSQSTQVVSICRTS